MCEKFMCLFRSLTRLIFTGPLVPLEVVKKNCYSVGVLTHHPDPTPGFIKESPENSLRVFKDITLKIKIIAQTRYFCVCGSHLQNGKPVWGKNPGKVGKKMENGLRPEMAEKWPLKWKNKPQNGSLAIFSPFFHSGGHFPAISGWGPFSIFPFCRIFPPHQFPIQTVDGHHRCKLICSVFSDGV